MLEPDEGKLCAVSRTDGIATRGGRSSGSMTPRRTTDLDPKGRGDKSMLVKRGTAEDVYAVVLQRLSDTAKTGLFEPPISRGGTAHSLAAHLTPTPSRAMGSTFAGAPSHFSGQVSSRAW